MPDLKSVSPSTVATFDLGEGLVINRLGFGAMRITGPGIWGPPDDSSEAVRTLRNLAELGVNFIDTADSYGPDVSSRLIREALYPYDGVIIATKAGLRRPGPDRWQPDGRPEYLRQRLERSLDTLGLEQIPLWQLHMISPNISREEQFDAIRALQSEGLIKHVGLCQVSVDDIRAATRYFPVATVQNRYNFSDRQSEDVLAYCEKNHIGFIPWAPLDAGLLASTSSPLTRIASAHGVSPGQIALAWLLQKSPVIIPTPGTSNRRHLVENVAARDITLTEREMVELNALGHEAKEGVSQQ
jgi:pyridoxine 4-dehydrogenase